MKYTLLGKKNNQPVAMAENMVKWETNKFFKKPVWLQIKAKVVTEMAEKVLFPGDTIGIVGDSPNGIMMAAAAKRLGFKVIVCGSNESSPTMQAADVRIVGTSKEKLQDLVTSVF